MPTVSLAEIQKDAQALSAARDELDAVMQELLSQIQTVKGPVVPRIRQLARKVSQLHVVLAEVIKDNPELFAKPRTFIVDGIRFGLVKGGATYSWDSDEALCARIHLAVADDVISQAEADLLIATTEKPVAAAIKKLDPAVLAKLQVEVAEGTDTPLIKSVDDGVEKAVNAVIKDATKNLEAVE